MFVASEMSPMIAGRIAPPRIAMTWREEPRLVNGPRFLMLRAKIVGNMMEWKKPISTRAQTDAGLFTERAMIIEVNEPAATIERRRGAGMLFISADPPKRPKHEPYPMSEQVIPCAT